MWPCDHSDYLEPYNVRDIKESTFFIKVRINRIFSESNLYRFEMHALEKYPIDEDKDGW